MNLLLHSVFKIDLSNHYLTSDLQRITYIETFGENKYLLCLEYNFYKVFVKKKFTLYKKKRQNTLLKKY